MDINERREADIAKLREAAAILHSYGFPGVTEQYARIIESLQLIPKTKGFKLTEEEILELRRLRALWFMQGSIGRTQWEARKMAADVYALELKNKYGAEDILDIWTQAGPA